MSMLVDDYSKTFETSPIECMITHFKLSSEEEGVGALEVGNIVMSNSGDVKIDL